MTLSEERERKVQDLYEGLEELRRQTLEVIRDVQKGHIEDATSEIIGGELAVKMTLVKDCAEAVLTVEGKIEERAINRADGYGCVD